MTKAKMIKPARGITFSGAMMGAGIEGYKSQTRRLLWDRGGRRNWLASLRPGDLLYTREPVKWAEVRGSLNGRYAADFGFLSDADQEALQAIGQGARLQHVCGPLNGRRFDPAPDPDWSPSQIGKWCQPRIMPLFANRCTLRVTGVRIERVDQISEADARAEGVMSRFGGSASGLCAHWGAWERREGAWSVEALMVADRPVDAFSKLWNTLHCEDGRRFEDGPEVAVISFEWVNRPVWEVLGIAPALLFSNAGGEHD